MTVGPRFRRTGEHQLLKSYLLRVPGAPTATDGQMKKFIIYYFIVISNARNLKWVCPPSVSRTVGKTLGFGSRRAGRHHISTIVSFCRNGLLPFFYTHAYIMSFLL